LLAADAVVDMAEPAANTANKLKSRTFNRMI